MLLVFKFPLSDEATEGRISDMHDMDNIKVCDFCLQKLGSWETHYSHFSPHQWLYLRHWMTSELAWQIAGVVTPTSRVACRCGSSQVTEAGAIGWQQSMAVLSCYGNLDDTIRTASKQKR